MKRSIFILGIISIITLSLTACGKPGSSFEETVDSLTHSELSKMVSNTENYKQNFNISSHFYRPGDKNKSNIIFSTSTRRNVKDSEGETKISIRIDTSGASDLGEEAISIDGNAIIKYLPRGIYFKLNSLNTKGLDDAIDDSSLNLSGINNLRYSFELTDEMVEKINAELPKDFDINALHDKEKLDNLTNNLKKSIINEGSLIYKGRYSEFSGHDARKFSIDKEKAFEAIIEYIKGFVPEKDTEEFSQSLEDMNIDEIFEDFPFKNFEGYLVITGKDNVQIVIENLDIKDEISTKKVHGTFGKNKYELIVDSEGKEIFILSARLNKNHYVVILSVNNSRILKGTITPKKSIGKFSIDFDLSINIQNNEDKINIPLKGQRTWKEISKFNIERPENSKNLLEDIMGNIEDLDPATYQSLIGGMGKQDLTVPIIAGGILAASLTPRMQSAQGRARDVARKNDLSQIQTVIITSQRDKGKWPGMDNGATKGISVSNIEKEIKEAGLYSVPTDPIPNNINFGLGENYKNKSIKGDYLYLVAKRNGVENGGFVLMSKTEVEGSSNWVVCDGKDGIKNGYINNNTDLANIKLCRSFIKGETCSSNADECTYTNEKELRYILLY